MTGSHPTLRDPRLLATKLHVPRPRRDIVRRPRLTDRRSVAQRPLLTLVSAPAGFGKTTLLSQWFAGSDATNPSTAWLALDAGDNDPSLFGSYLVAALQSLSPQVGATAMSLLRSAQPLRAAVAALINDIAVHADDVTIVLDDYHLVDAAEVHDAVAFLLDHAPANLHVVLATRADPPLPLARLRARGDLLEIRAGDLRFSIDEAATYLNGAMDLRLDADRVGALEARTEGWIAALQLAALSMQGRDDVAAFIENFTGDDRFVVDYLAEEVLDRQSADVRNFLVQTSVLDRLSGPLCDAVVDSLGSKAMLETLDRANLFLVRLDDRRQWYRYHHLFADVLRARLLDEQPEHVAGLHLRASTWYERNDEVIEAIVHAMAGHHLERAAQLIETVAAMMRQTRQEATLRRWLETLPDAIFDARPVLTMSLVGARMATGDPAGVEALMNRVEQWLDPNSTPIVFDQSGFARLPTQLAIHRAGLALLTGDINDTITHARTVLDLTEPSDHFPRGAASALLGLAQWSQGDLDGASGRYGDAVDCFARTEFISDRLGCSLALADIQVAQGQLREAAQTLESALEQAAGHGTLRGVADMHAGLSEIALAHNDLDAAARHLQTSSDLGEHAGLPQHAYRWRVALARLRQASGDLEGALTLLDEAERVYNTDFSPSIRPIAAVRARVQLVRGDVSSALRWAADRGLSVDDELTYVREYEHITLAHTLLAEGTRHPRRVEDAVRLLDRLLNAAEHRHRTGNVIEILVALAIGHEMRGEQAGSMTALDRALTLAAPQGQLRVFIDAGPALLTSLRSARLGVEAARHARAVLVAIGAGGASRPPLPGLVDDLSSRELDVLRLLRSDLSGPDIARELHVSLNTLRTHTKNIYTKLGVTNRREALRRAGELGL